jgi:2-dehydro-3-deoxygluconokinase
VNTRVVTFGEIMLRLSPPGYDRFVQAQYFKAHYGGGEANVALSLANYGVNSCFVTKVPLHEIGQCAVNVLREYGVDTSHILRGGERLGIYYCENGASQRPSKVIYDRAGSAFATVRPEEFNWSEILAGARWFHFTGITPALGENVAAATLAALKIAKQYGMTTSVDLNYRKKLWTPIKANQVMTGLMDYIDIVIANEEDVEKVFGIKAMASDVTKGQIHRDGYREVANQLVSRFGLKKVAITLRESKSASDNDWSAILFDGNEFFSSPKYNVHIVDRVGGGDSFAGGLIYSILSGKTSQEALNFAVAASCLKHSINGDFNLVDVSEVETLASGDASGRVQR